MIATFLFAGVAGFTALTELTEISKLRNLVAGSASVSRELPSIGAHEKTIGTR